MIKCKNPKLIINPAVYEYVGLWNHCYLDGVFQTIFTNKLELYHFYYKLKNIKSNLDPKIDYSDVYYCLDRFERKVPIFLSVPCNHCVLCLSKRQNSLVQRLQFESECHQFEPYFITLTHNKMSLPKDNTPRKSVIQMYIKRLRNYCYEDYGCDIRFYGQGELGKKHGRTHYHFLIFGLPKLDWKQQFELFSKAWRTKKFYKTVRHGQIVNAKLSLGRVTCSHVNSPEYREWYKKNKGRELKDTDGVLYATKYSTKDSVVQSWSERLGCAYVEQHYKDLLHRPHAPIDLIFKNRYGREFPVIKDRWFFQTCFDTYNRSTYKFRKLIYDMIQADCYNITKGFSNYFNWYVKLFNGKFYDYMGINFDQLNHTSIASNWLKLWYEKRRNFKRYKSWWSHIVYSPNRLQIKYLIYTFYDEKFWHHLESEENIYRTYLKRCFENVPELTPDDVDILYRKKSRYRKLVQLNVSL